MQKKNIALGISDYKRIIEENYYYIDKTLLIKELIDNGMTVTLLPRPRRFGKTLCLSMLKYFFEETQTDNSHLFKQFKIWHAGEEYREKQGKYPVIFLTLKDVKSDTWPMAYSKIIDEISLEYQRHEYLLRSDILNPWEKETIENVIYKKASDSDYENAIKNLCIYLKRHHGQRVIVLIDEYDTPIHSGYFYGYYTSIINFMRNFLGGGLKDNNFLEKGIVTGILRVAKESIFSGINNLEFCSVLSYQYSDKFGFIEEETEDILKYFETDDKIDQVRKWYNGYKYGDTTVYNPWSVLSYIRKRKEGFVPHWINTSSNDLVKILITQGGESVKKELEDLISRKSIRKEVNEDTVFSEIEKSSGSVWSFLLFGGYLKVAGRDIENKRVMCNLMIPNLEVEYFFERIIDGWFAETIQSDKSEMMLNSLVRGDIETFEDIFAEYVEKSMSFFDPQGNDAEKVYHSFVLGLLVNLSSSYEVKSNRESGHGRYDIIVIPKNPEKPGVIIEFKKVNRRRKETLEEACQEALRQVEDRNYKQELTDRGVGNIISLGIAFNGKDIMIKRAN